MDFEKLFTEGHIGTLTLKNRGVMTPMATELADRDGLATQRQITYYQTRAKGGVGLIITEYTGVDDVDSIPSIHNLRAAQDYHTTELEHLTDAVHLYGSKIIAQLHHGGATSNPALSGRDNLAPSAVPIDEGRPVPKEMTKEDIKRIQQKFVDAAVRCKKAGYDGVELHGAHGYLIAQFFSKYYNRRTDEYGGSAENRCRFLTEIIAAIREKLKSYPILVRMCGDEMTDVEGFLTMEDGIEIAKILQAAGIDAIDISMGSARNADANCEPFSYESGWKKHVAKAYKEALDIPVIATNTIKSPAFAESLLEEGVCDFVGLGRAHLADPDFMNKAKQGKADEIRTCVGCLYCRERVLGQGMPIRCAVNATTGREIEFPKLKRDGRGQTVAVIGGGPAGMEAARVLAKRWFDVVLFEKEAMLGGTVRTAALGDYKDKLIPFLDGLTAELNALNVDVRLGQEATVRDVQKLSAVGVVIACGATPIIPNLPGVDLPHVATAEQVLLEQAHPEGNVAVIGSGLTGLEAAETLLGRGAKVTIIEMADEIAPGVFPAIRNDELSRILPHEPTLYTGHKLIAIEEGQVTLTRLSDGKTVKVPADGVVLALGVQPRSETVRAFQDSDAFDTVCVIGDANRGKRIADAIRQGYEAGYTFGMHEVK